MVLEEHRELEAEHRDDSEEDGRPDAALHDGRREYRPRDAVETRAVRELFQNDLHSTSSDGGIV